MTTTNKNETNESTHGEAFDECAYCGHDTDIASVPAVDDDAAWAVVAKQHKPDCEWVMTRAHRVAAPHHYDVREDGGAETTIYAADFDAACELAEDWVRGGDYDLERGEEITVHAYVRDPETDEQRTVVVTFDGTK